SSTNICRKIQLYTIFTIIYLILLNLFSHANALGTYRQGLTDKWTVGGHSELTAKIQNVGFTNQYLLSNYGVLTNSLAVSRYLKHQGILFSQGFTRQSNPVGFGTKIQVTKGDFGEIGLYQSIGDKTSRTPQLTLQNFASYASKDYGIVSLSYTERRGKKMPTLKLMTINYNKPVAKNFNLNIFASHDFKRQNKQVGLSLVYVIDDRSSAIATTQYQPKNSSKSLAYQESKVMDSNVSYRLLASQGAHSQYETQIDIDEEIADYKIRASRVRRDNNIELNARGAMIYFDNKVFLSKYIYNSFGIAQVPELSGVSVYESNRLVGKTNADGYLLLPNLRSYEDNDIKIDCKELPLDAVFKDDNVFIKPARRSGAIARFDVSTLKMFTIRVVDENHNDLNPGTILHDPQKIKKYVVGLDGEVYIEVPLNQQETKLEVGDPHNCVVKISDLNQNQLSDEINKYQCKNISNL
ncbi:MAG: fimbria/pilus outer membrane usher protein, partial [Janthinobacterium lividum]